MSSESSRTVLVVDDKRSLADLYTRFLEERYQVETAYSGEQALEAMNSDIDAVLLDRRMPDISGHEVLETIRDREYDCRVAMVTAVDPDFDIIDMGFDDYATKPINRSELHDVVERLLDLDEYDELLQKYYQHVSKKAALEAEKDGVELESSEEFIDLKETIAELKTELEAKNEAMADVDIRNMLR